MNSNRPASQSYYESQEKGLMTCGTIGVGFIALAIFIIFKISQCRSENILPEFITINSNKKFEFSILDINNLELQALIDFAKDSSLVLLKSHIDRPKADSDIYEFLKCGEEYPNYDSGRGIEVLQEIVFNGCNQ